MGGGKPGKAPAARSKTRGGYGAHDYCHHSGSTSRQDYSRRNKNSNQKRFPAAAKGGGGGRGHQNYHHQPPQGCNSIAKIWWPLAQVTFAELFALQLDTSERLKPPLGLGLGS